MSNQLPERVVSRVLDVTEQLACDLDFEYYLGLELYEYEEDVFDVRFITNLSGVYTPDVMGADENDDLEPEVLSYPGHLYEGDDPESQYIRLHSVYYKTYWHLMDTLRCQAIHSNCILELDYTLLVDVERRLLFEVADLKRLYKLNKKRLAKDHSYLLACASDNFRPKRDVRQAVEDLYALPQDKEY